MKKTYTALAVGIALAIGGYFATAPSAACCGDGAIAAQGAVAAGATVSSAISGATTSVVNMLIQIDDNIAAGFGKLYTELAKQTASERTIQEGVVQAQTQIYLEGKRAEAEVAMKVSPRACYELQAADAIAKSENSYNAAVQSVTSRLTDRTLYTPNAAAAVSQIFRDHAQFCSDQDVRLGRCNRAAPKDVQNADIRADNLLARDAFGSDAQRTGAETFIRNVVNPMPTQMLPKGWEGTEAGRTFVAGQMVEQARNNVAAQSFAHMLASRDVQPGLGTQAGLNKPNVSRRELVRSQADGRFLSPQWYTMLAGFNDTNLLREMNKQMAFSLWMDYQALEQNERIEALLATDLAASVKRDSEQRLAEARQAAARAK